MSPCNAFVWIGQSFTTCENCSRPYWDHRFREGPALTPFGQDYELIEITTEEALAVRRKWEGWEP